MMYFLFSFAKVSINSRNHTERRSAPALQFGEPVESQTRAGTSVSPQETPDIFVWPVPPHPRTVIFSPLPLRCIRRNAITFGTMIKHIVLAGTVQRMSTTPKYRPLVLT